MKRFPFITLLISALACLLMLLPATAHNALYFDHQQLARGHFWVLLTGHWIHADVQHLAWNVTALAVLAAILETRSRRLLLWSLCIGTVCVDLLLLSPLSLLQRYCGLSGLLNTLLGVALYQYWRETRSTLVILVAILCIAKIALEIFSGQSVFTDISWPPFAMAHLAGMLGVPWVISASKANNSGHRSPIPLPEGKNHGHLVTGK